MYLRILSIRRHKSVTFINGYSKQFGKCQFMIDNDIVGNIKCGDLIKIDFSIILNNKGVLTKKINNILEIISCTNFDSGKGINNTIINQKEKNYIDARNCGNQLNFMLYKHELIQCIKKILDEKGYLDVSSMTNMVEHYANGSNIKDAIIENRDDNEPKYLRTTIENQLKQITALSLNSTYAIEKVFRNMGEDNSHINEFLMLEIVSLTDNIDEFKKFIYEIDELSKNISDKHNLQIPNKKIEIIDYNEIAKCTNYEILRKSFLNTLVINYPCISPFIKKDEIDGIRKEARWYINGHWISHYYRDENCIENVEEILKIQQANKVNTINPLEYFEWGLPSTISFGLSIDRWLQMLFDFENINSVANPLELDHCKRKVKVKL